MALYAIGDIQGCRQDLERLLERLRFDPARDRLWFCGDLVNRGPDSLGTLRLIRELGEAALSVLGNHDIHLLAVAAGVRPPRRKDTFHDVLRAPDRDELLHWLRRRPLLHHDPRLGHTLVHAGLPPQWDLATARRCAEEVHRWLSGPRWGELIAHIYGDGPARWEPTLEGWPRLRYSINALTRIRYVDRRGHLDLGYKGPPDQAPPGLIPWFRHPERRNRDLAIVFGHWSTLGPVDDPGIHPLDTGCVWGGRLTALRLDRTPPRPQTLPCRGALAPGDD